MEIKKIFNPKKTIFLGMDENGRVGGRGRFFSELSPDEYPTIKGCVIAGYKKRNLNNLVDLFPNLIQLTIEKTSNLVNLEGIGTLSDLQRISIEDCPKLMDLSELINCVKLSEVRLASFKNTTNVLSFLLPQTVTDLSIHGNVADLEKIYLFKSLIYLSLNGHGSDLEALPVLPKVKKNFHLEGFPKLKDASFMSNLDAEMRIAWWGPKPIAGIPKHLQSLDTFK